MRSFFLAAHYYLVGKDRQKRYRLAKDQSRRGSIVIFDRFPFFSPLDGPEISESLEKNQGWAVRKLADMENKLYKSFDTLDLLIVLEVDPGESIKRKPDHSPETIRYKYEALARLKRDLGGEEGKFKWVVVNANEPIDDVLLEIKRTLWALL
jgi:thymidylate kinase